MGRRPHDDADTCRLGHRRHPVRSKRKQNQNQNPFPGIKQTKPITPHACVFEPATATATAQTTTKSTNPDPATLHILIVLCTKSLGPRPRPSPTTWIQSEKRVLCLYRRRRCWGTSSSSSARRARSCSDTRSIPSGSPLGGECDYYRMIEAGGRADALSSDYDLCDVGEPDEVDADGRSVSTMPTYPGCTPRSSLTS
jgi:hypothetical protein